MKLYKERYFDNNMSSKKVYIEYWVHLAEKDLNSAENICNSGNYD